MGALKLTFTSIKAAFVVRMTAEHLLKKLFILFQRKSFILVEIYMKVIDEIL